MAEISASSYILGGAAGSGTDNRPLWRKNAFDFSRGSTELNDAGDPPLLTSVRCLAMFCVLASSAFISGWNHRELSRAVRPSSLLLFLF